MLFDSITYMQGIRFGILTILPFGDYTQQIDKAVRDKGKD